MKEHMYRPCEDCGAENQLFCPVKDLCVDHRRTYGNPLGHKQIVTNKGDVFRASSSHGNRVFVVLDGIYASVIENEQGREIFYALYGNKSMLGLAELYFTEQMRETYHIKTFIPGQLCSIPSKDLERYRTNDTQDSLTKLVLTNFVEQVSASVVFSRISTQNKLRERIVLLLLLLRDATGNKNVSTLELEITHEELAKLAYSDRASTTKVLQQIQKDKLVELGFGKIIPFYNKFPKKYKEKYTEVIEYSSFSLKPL